MILAACGTTPAANGRSDAGSDRDAEAPDAARGDAGSVDGGRPVVCASSTAAGGFPVRLDLPHDGDNGVFDASLELDPETGRLWMAYSSVDGPPGSGRVSTYLAYSEDGGATWCTPGVVNPAVDVPSAEAPPNIAGRRVHWNQEVPVLVLDPSAAPSERWKLLWHRFLVADDADPATEDRQFQHGWIALRSAASPDGLYATSERKLFSAGLYHASPAVEAYNDARLGPPETSWRADPKLDHCLALSEPGALAADGMLHVSLLCRTASEASTVLVELDRTGPQPSWRAVGTLLSAQEAQAIVDAAAPGAPRILGVSATALFRVAGRPKLSVSPVSLQGAYLGCWLFDLDLSTGTLSGSPLRPSVVDHAAGTIQSGACTYDDAATATGLVFGETHRDGVQFRLFGRGPIP